MNIDWSKQRCFVCSGEFKASSVQVINEQTGKTSTHEVKVCVRCGDTALSPDQHTAQKMKQVTTNCGCSCPAVRRPALVA